MILKLIVPKESLSIKRPIVTTKRNIETTVDFKLSFDEIRPIIERYLHANYPEFRRKNLELEIDFLTDYIACRGHKHEE